MTFKTKRKLAFVTKILRRSVRTLRIMAEKDKERVMWALRPLQKAIRDSIGIKIWFHLEPGLRGCKPKIKEVYGFDWFIVIGFISILHPCSNHH